MIQFSRCLTPLLALGAQQLVADALKEPACNFSVELVHLQDYSDTVRDDIDNLRSYLPPLMSDLQAVYPNSRTGFATFVDKPLAPFGFPYEGPWFTGDWCWEMSAKLEADHDLEQVINDFLAKTPGGGNDFPENQLGALHDVVLNQEVTGWSGRNSLSAGGLPIQKVVVVSTDAFFHAGPDGERGAGLRPNDGDWMTDCATEDYPSIEQTTEALLLSGVYTIFLVADDGDNNHEEMLDTYRDLLKDSGAPGMVTPLLQNSANIVQAMDEALGQMNDFVCRQPTLDVAFLADATYSYRNDLGQLSRQIDQFTESLSHDFVHPRYAFATFGDKPVRPFGHAGSGDFCYRLVQGFTADRVTAVRAAEGLKMVSGLDWRESQLDALLSIVVDENAGWRQGDQWNGFQHFKIAVLATDSGYHRAPDAQDAGLEVAPRSEMAVVNCLGEEYPSWEQVGRALAAKGVSPLFIPTSDIAGIYHDLQEKIEKEFGVRGAVVELENFDTLPEAVLEGIEALQGRLTEERQIGG